MPSAGEVIEAWHGARVGTNTETSNTSTFTTTETVTDDVTVSLVNGERYLVEFNGAFQTSVAGDDVTARIREDNLAGTQLQGERRDILAGSINQYWYIRAEYTATATGSKTFVVTGVRSSGSGNIFRAGATTGPAYLTVTHIKEV